LQRFTQTGNDTTDEGQHDRMSKNLLVVIDLQH